MPKPKKATREEAAAREPRGTLSIRTLCLPADTNQYGEIFGGWLLGQMDIAGGILASKAAGVAPRRLPSTP
jgi:acyl-CoA thioesterase YciA